MLFVGVIILGTIRIGLLEEFKILLLNRRNRVLGVVNISHGGLSGTVADPIVIFAAALKACAFGIILAHNHPSGEIDPSREDIALTTAVNRISNNLPKIFSTCLQPFIRCCLQI